MAKTNDSNKDAVQNGNFKVLEPPHNLHLARKIGVVKCRVDLYKIPPQYINFEPTKTHLYLDTFKYSKKFKLEIPYPEGVEVDTNVEATFDSGVLKCDFPILNDPNKPAGLDKIVEAREIVKELRKKGIPVPTDVMKSAQMAKVKERPSDESAEDSKKKAAKKGKVPLSNKEKRQKEKAKRALTEDPDEPRPRKKKAKTEQDTPKKSFMENASDALSMVDEVNDQQEKAIQEKMDREYNKLSVDTRKKIERQEKKLQLRALRKQEAEDADTTKPKKVKSNKKKTTKVSFAE